tara:strand:+ start:10086 stop:10520 length:435 start_codon:yes stop_codon:yes gene_type:complete
MPVPLSVSERFQKIAKGKSFKIRQELLQKYGNDKAVYTILKYAFSPRITWDLPKGPTPYEDTKLVGLEGRLYSEIRRLKIFTTGGYPGLQQVRRERLWIEVLESIDPEDAKILDMAKDGKFTGKYSKITEKLVNAVWPDIFRKE